MPLSGVGQTLPQAPQLLTSVSNFWQPPLHAPKPGAQASPHTEFWQIALACGAPLHVPAQSPQWLGSFSGFTHEPPQFVVPVGQVEVHFPLVHTSFCWHFVPQAPQLLGS